jgi:hypothetical protein
VKAYDEEEFSELNLKQVSPSTSSQISAEELLRDYESMEELKREHKDYVKEKIPKLIYPKQKSSEELIKIEKKHKDDYFEIYGEEEKESTIITSKSPSTSTFKIEKKEDTEDYF